jgi:hypothetical protein
MIIYHQLTMKLIKNVRNYLSGKVLTVHLIRVALLPRKTNIAPELNWLDKISCANKDKPFTPFLISVRPVHKYILVLDPGANMIVLPKF